MTQILDKNRDFAALLGTKGGPAIRPGSTNPTSSLLCMDGRLCVVDCGLGVTRGLVDQGMALADLDLVFITHLHSDHYLEMGPLIHTAWTAGLRTPIRVLGPQGIALYWEAFLQSMKADIDLRIADEGRPDLASLVSITTIDEGRILEEGNLAVDALRNDHPPLIESFALRFEANGRKVVFSGDTAPFPPLVDFAQGADLLIHEAMLEEALEALAARVGNGDDRLLTHLRRSHSTASEAAQIATRSGVRALALNHLIPSDDPAYSALHWEAATSPHWHGELHLGRDGLKILLD